MTTEWQEQFANKVVTAARAVRSVWPGNRVFVGSACGEPQALVRALVEASSHL